MGLPLAAPLLSRRRRQGASNFWIVAKVRVCSHDLRGCRRGCSGTPAAFGLARERWLQETLTRAGAYVDAGADGVFVLGTLDATSIAALVSAVSVPVNVLVGPGTLPVPDLAEAGVTRVSASGLDYATLNALILRPVPQHGSPQ